MGSIDPSRDLSSTELAILSAMYVPDGRWEVLGIDEEEACDLAAHFFHCLRGDLREGLEICYTSLQNALMAQRKETFEDIQKEPPFSVFGEANMYMLLEGWLENGKPGVTSRWPLVFPPGWQSKKPVQSPVRVLVDTGESPEHAIRILDAGNRHHSKIQEWYFNYIFGKSWKRESLVSDETHDLVDISLPNHVRRRYYFER